MASPDETLREELVRFLTHVPPSRLPQRADGGHYAVALAPCCTPALKRQCEAADAALARLRAETREDGRPGAEAVAAAARVGSLDGGMRVRNRTSSSRRFSSGLAMVHHLPG